MMTSDVKAKVQWAVINSGFVTLLVWALFYHSVPAERVVSFLVVVLGVLWLLGAVWAYDWIMKEASAHPSWWKHAAPSGAGTGLHLICLVTMISFGWYTRGGFFLVFILCNNFMRYKLETMWAAEMEKKLSSRY